ncbi:hypothetical protein [Halorubrum sp. CBA1229]|jgi:hypothetical protein|uniref:DUF7312 domain-containing protein n=1 Tax=Halorubrum sp. CBA1229 TaxID=1853699 RepID=UPI000F40716E|nr:hypothetical protein [Halorubrum sp. CBA1229]QKY15867.1 hypothetical protein Hrr1229_002875 [Halorubrum sp. CBA1229]
MQSDEADDDANVTDGADAADGDTRIRANETRADAEESDERQWRFAVDDVGPDGITEDSGTPEDEPIEPGSIDFENAALVALGVAITVGVLLFGF